MSYDILELRRSMAAAIEGLYKTFSKYPLRSNMEACPCGCTSPNHVQALYSKPLRDLGPSEIDHYAFSALTTMGDANDFRHFLPRLFELTADHKLLTDPQIVFGHLRYAEWTRWPDVEQESIREYFDRIWRYALEFPPERDMFAPTPVDDWIAAIAQADRVEGYLSTWLRADSDAAVRNLCRFVWMLSDELRSGEPPAFWGNVPSEWETLLQWLRSAPVREKIAQSDSGDELKRADVERALSIIQRG